MKWIEDKAKQQLRRLERVERSGDFVGARFQTLLRVAAYKAMRLNGEVVIGELEIMKLNDAMAKVAAGAYILELDHIKNTELSLSFMSDRRKAARRLNLRLGDIQQKFLTTTGRPLRRSIAKLSASLNGSIRHILEQGLSKTRSYQLFRDRLNALGLQVGDEIPGVAKTWIRTGASLATNSARWEATIDDPEIWGYTYLTMRDDRVREAHEKLEGYTRRKEDYHWQIIWPPNGWNCRCQVVALTHSNRIRQSRRIPEIESYVDDEFIGELIYV